MSILKLPEEFSQEEIKEYQDWFDARPEFIREMILKHPPFFIYGLPGHKDYYTIEVYSENGTVKMLRWDRDNHKEVHLVFGQDPDDLEIHHEAKAIEAVRNSKEGVLVQ